VKEVTALLESSPAARNRFRSPAAAQLDKEFAAPTGSLHSHHARHRGNEAQLTGYLVSYSDPKTQKKPEVSYYYAYMAYDARVQRIAGSLAEDPLRKGSCSPPRMTIQDAPDA